MLRFKVVVHHDGAGTIQLEAGVFNGKQGLHLHCARCVQGHESCLTWELGQAFGQQLNFEAWTQGFGTGKTWEDLHGEELEVQGLRVRMRARVSWIHSWRFSAGKSATCGIVSAWSHDRLKLRLHPPNLCNL